MPNRVTSGVLALPAARVEHVDAPQAPSIRSRLPLDLVDVGLLLGLIVLCAAFARWFVQLGTHPYEDAAILMRYSEHLAAGHGIVWNIGERPVDGATDFLFVCAVAALEVAGLSGEVAVRLLGLLAYGATVLLI